MEMGKVIKTTREMIEVMEAYERGEEIECIIRDYPNDEWQVVPKPSWDWRDFDFRIAATPDKINWDHVAPEYKWMARDRNGGAYFYKNKPNPDGVTGYWSCVDDLEGMFRAESHSSYNRGTCDWKDSLVERPSK